jgi:cellulose synthase/poly-beta-1,6-N-acetylglucosamine synthase-like glycosyltransferase
VNVSIVRRAHRDGFKAGALSAGMERSDAEYIAIFDADFVPHADFIRRALPLFQAPGKRVACVQGRWEHLNREQNWLTRAQAVGVDAHFRVQQLGRAAAGAFLNFNGTAGMWRRAAIEDAGGWCGDTLTEDLDLSYRAQLGGWRIVFDPTLGVPAELPPTLGAFKSQQRRWACGSIQCARRFLGPVWRSDHPFRVKTEATAHLGGYLVCLAMLALVLLLPFGVTHLAMLAQYPALWPFWAAIWIAALGPITMSVAGQRLSGRVAPREVLGCFLLGLGACANNAIAVLRGATRPIRTFVRTPKQGSLPRPVSSPAPVLEAFMGVFTVASMVVLAYTQPWAVATYALFCAAGFCAVTAYWWLHEKAA